VKSKAMIQPFATNNKDNTGSQQNWQWTRHEGFNGSYKSGAYRGNIKDKNNLHGNIAELSHNVYQYGTQDQGDRFTRATEAIPTLLEESIVKK
jgi:hypothetical protein